MKVKLTFVIMSLLGTLSHSSKLLKVPRVYNAFVTSDEDLRSSQAYPVLAPLVQGFHYPLPRYVSSNVYRMFSVPNQVQYSSDTRSYSYSVQNTVKEDYYQYSVVESGGLRPFLFELPMISAIEARSPGEPIILFLRSENAAKYFESSPVELVEDNPPDPRQPPLESDVKDVRLQRAQRFRGTTPTAGTKSVDMRSQRAQRYRGTTPAAVAKGVGRSSLPDLNSKKRLPTDGEESKTDPDDGSDSHSINIDDVVKNNRPKDKSIVDVPPPPIPVRWKTNRKSPGANRSEEEYPPPPVGFI